MSVPTLNERIDLAAIDCREVVGGRRQTKNYFNGWHDTHPIFSTLMGYMWRWLDFNWTSLWPLAGSIGALTLIPFYLIPRAFSVPWHVALLLFPACVPFHFLKGQFYFLRDFSKVPFILLAFTVLCLLFRRDLTHNQRIPILSLSTAIVVLGSGFRQDTLVLLPTVVAAAILSASIGTRRGALRLAGDLATIAASFLILSLLVQGLKTTQVAQLEGYAHFIVQGFADPFWKEARTEVPGISFLAVYSDMLAWAAVDANSPEQVGYFGSLDPLYTPRGFDLIATYARLSAGDAVVKVFSGLSATSHGYWLLAGISTWFVLLLVLVALGKWRIATFIAFAMLSLAAAGSLQFAPRHSLHLIMLDRAMTVVIFASIIHAVWQQFLQPSRLQIGRALLMGSGAVGLLVLLLLGAYAVQRAALIDLKAAVDRATWYPSRAALAAAVPGRSDAVRRVTIAPADCPDLDVTMIIDGEKVVRRLKKLDNAPRNIYFAAFSPAISKMTVDLPEGPCVAGEAWAALGDGVIAPLQMFDPLAAIEKQTLSRLVSNLANAFR